MGAGSGGALGVGRSVGAAASSARSVTTPAGGAAGLAGSAAGGGDYYGGRWYGGYGGYGDPGEGPVSPTWKNRRNFLTQALDAIGALLIARMVGGLLTSLIAGDGLALRLSGIIGSIIGAIVLLAILKYVRGRIRAHGS